MQKTLAGLALGTALATFAWAQGVDAADYTIRLAHSLSATEPAHLAAEFFAANVNERSGGRIEMAVFPGEQLGSGKDVNEMIRQGANVMNITDAGYLSDYVPDIGILNGPYLMADYRDFQKIVDSEWLAEVDAQLQEAGIRVVSYNNLFGRRHMIADMPIRTPADIEGVTVRVPPNQMWLATFEAMGARPTTVQWSEVYNALSQNVVAAAEAPLGSLWGSKLHEVKDTISLTGHFTAFAHFTMSEDFFQSLPEDLQTIMLEEGKRAGEEMTRLTLEKQDEYIGLFEDAGVTIVEDVDIPAFQDATASVYEAFPQWTPGLHAKIQAILAQ
jgi:tripartite ATP-independent transporter DctP family solute receptor